MEKKVYRLGVIGTGRIAHRFVPEARVVEGLEVVSVYNPRNHSAKKFAEEFGILNYTNQLEEFSHMVEAVYIATPHETHVSYARQMLEAGKHVLCEKPLCFSKAEAEELFALAKKNNCVLMEGIKTAYCPGFLKLIEVAKGKQIGEIKCVEACFTKLENLTNRELVDVKYGGSFTELGSYVLLPIIELLGNEYKNVKFESLYADNGLDIYTKAYFRYNSELAVASCGLGVKAEGQMIISGTKGYILVKAPWWKTTEFEVRDKNGNEIEKYIVEFIGDGLRYEIKEFMNLIEKKTHEMKNYKKNSVDIACIMEKFFQLNSR